MVVSDLLIRLALARGIGTALITRLMQHPEWATFLMGASCDLAKAYGISSERAALISRALRDDELFHKHTVWCKQTETTILTLCDKAYPALLRHIAVAPPVLWVQGALSTQSDACALVGARAATNYAERAVRLLIPDIAAAGIVTVSGGARGVDSAVHRATLDAGGRTVVVAGSGLAHCYPLEHRSLFDDIRVQGGALVSSFAPWVEPTKGTFPVRNRLIAGLSQVCVVVQAAARSGALITADHALNENRSVGAVPGPIDDSRYAGSNQLLVQGAFVVSGSQSILEQYGRNETPQRQTSVLEAIDPEEQALLDLLEYPQTFDDLVGAGHTDQPRLQALLSRLEIQGKIRQNFAGLWERHE